jgi:predicted ATPase
VRTGGLRSVSGSIATRRVLTLTAVLGMLMAAVGASVGVVAVSWSTAVVGAPLRNSGTGAAYVFVRCVRAFWLVVVSAG